MYALLWIAFVSGVATSLGPCLVPRYLGAVVQMRGTASGLAIGSFFAGCIGGYMAFAAGAVLLTFVQTASHVVYT
ncbi:MAG: hypothetical protein ACRENA_05560, partial [Vulcanimicrobiaceae bacterium]